MTPRRIPALPGDRPGPAQTRSHALPGPAAVAGSSLLQQAGAALPLVAG